MTRHIALFGEMGANYAPIIEQALASYADWQVDIWPCNEDMARDSVLAQCEAAIISPDYILTPGNFGALMAAPNLKILLQPWVGTDWLNPGFLPKGLIYCNAGGHAPSMAEYVMAAVLEQATQLRDQHADMRAGNWRRAGRNAAPDARHGFVTGKTLGLVGYGDIGEAVAKRAHAFDMRLAAIARRKRDAAPAPLDWIGTPDDLSRLLAESDYLVLTCDLNEETQGMIDAAAFEQMKPSAYLVNVARGEGLMRRRCSTRCKTAALPVRRLIHGIAIRPISPMPNPTLTAVAFSRLARLSVARQCAADPAQLGAYIQCRRRALYLNCPIAAGIC